MLPGIKNGLTSVGEFVKYAHSISNRRKSRAGTSLELNLESIFVDEKLLYSTQAQTENRKKPDFLFPSDKDCHNLGSPSSKLSMMAAKTCCKDRWRQTLSEADRICPEQLFTLQQGVSGNQLQEMQDNNVVFVIPAPHLESFPVEWRNRLQTLTNSIFYIKAQQSR